MISHKSNSRLKKLFSRIPKLESVLFVSTFFWFSLSAGPTISWGDSADLATRLSGNQILDWEGTSRDYDLYESLGRVFSLIPIGDYGYRANLMSSFFGAVAVMFLFKVVSRAAKSTISGLIAAISLCTSHTFWLLSSIAEVYTVSITLLLASILVLLQWSESSSVKNSALLGAIIGLFIFHHPSGLVVFFSHLVYLVVWKRQEITFKKSVAFLSLFLPITLLSNWYKNLISNLKEDLNLGALLPIPPSNSLHESQIASETFYFLAFVVYNFPLIIPGLLLLIRNSKLLDIVYRSPILVLTVNATMTGIATISSSIPDKYNMYVIVYPFFAVVIGLLGQEMVKWLKEKRKSLMLMFVCLLAINPVMYFTTWKLGNSLQLDLSGARTLEGRENNKYFVWPPKNGDYNPRKLAIQRLNSAPANSLVLADYTIFSTLKYVQLVEKHREDVEVLFVEQVPNWNLDAFVTNELQKNQDRRILIATNVPPSYYFLDSLSSKYELRGIGNLYEIVAKLVGPKK